ncbi:MAG: hypothetical protein PVF74_11995 [Anaerolineales bacterium]
MSESVIFSDQFGFVHVIWIENGYDDGRSQIYYSNYDGNTWAAPIDIYRAGIFDAIGHLSADIDQAGTIHLVWTEGGAYRIRPIYYMKAPAQEALSAQSWSKPLSLGIRAHLVNLLVDSEGILHFLFTKYYGNDPGVYYTQSDDRGDTWSVSTWLDPDIPVGHSPDKLKFSIDTTDGLHAVWYYGPTDHSSANWIRYSHSLDGLSWIRPVTIDKDNTETGRLSSSDPLIITQDEHIHILWWPGLAAEQDFARYHQISMNRGQTWGPAVPIFANLEGQAFDGLVVDSANRIHYFGQIRYPQGIYHAIFQNYQWSLPELIYLITRNSGEPISDDVIHAHHLHPALLAGNQLVLVLHDSPSDEMRQLYVMTRMLDDVPKEQIVSLSTSTPYFTPVSTLTNSTEIPIPHTTLQVDMDSTESNKSAINLPLWIGAGFALIFVGIVFVIRFIKVSK